MKVLIIQHSAADSPAIVGDVLESNRCDVQTIRIDRGDSIPSRVEADALMMFGGAISMTGDDLPSWVAEEQMLIRRYFDEGRRILGICLGSQILASALGATVNRNSHPEIGWHAIERVGPSAIIEDVFPNKLTVLHWHQDTFDIPPGATHLFRSEACSNQGFVIDDRVFGFQFHMEASARTVRTFLAVSEKWKLGGPYVQSESQITDGIESYLPNQSGRLKRFLSQFLA